jgi:penicillin-binding protein 2
MRSTRLLLLQLLTVVVALVFAGRLIYIQGARGAELRGQSVRNTQRPVRSPAPRGLILDAKGRTLVTNEPAMSAWLISGMVPREQWPALLDRLVTIGFFPDRDTADAALEDARRLPGYLPVRLATRLSPQMITRVEESLSTLPGLYLRPEPVRAYPHGTLAAHVLGYLREIDAVELQARAAQDYRPGDDVGRAGLERAFEDVLHGASGYDKVEIDAHGRVLRTLAAQAPAPGHALTLSLDLDVQRAAEQALAGHTGAAVALDTHTGDVLALVSAPGYDLNAMSGRRSPALQQWLERTHAEINRATRGRYAPGSVFKIVTAAAALEKGSVPGYFYCPGEYRGIHCWLHRGHGSLNLTEAVAQSCNVAFMKLAEGVGIRDLSAMARRFGLGRHTTLGTLLPESVGTVPDPAWAQRTFHRTWQLGDTLQVGIGQSSLEITPLQAARIAAAIANGGYLVQPRLVTRVDDTPQPRVPAASTGLRPATIRRIRAGLRAVTGEGTARSLDATLRIAGKTGTAQNPGGDDHAWFAGYAPSDKPRVAVAVLVEHGGHGGATAAPIAEAIIRVALNGPTPVTPEKPPTHP